jgi:uncharacterized protein YaeQ
MALKATIHKATVQLSDLDAQRYTDHQLTLARHPSETDERLMVRLLAYALHAPDNNDHGTLEFGKDMWDPDEPALWQHDLTNQLLHWIDMGQPDDKRLLRACGRAKRVTVYTYSGGATQAWWASNESKLARATNLTVREIPAEAAAELAALVDRSMDIQITVQEGTLFVSHGTRSVEIELIKRMG